MCEDCVENLRRHRGLLNVPAPDANHLAPPTRAELERHAVRFGTEGVAEVAEAHGIEVTVARLEKRARARGPSLRDRVREYVANGHSPEVIAEIENLSPPRARRLMKEVE